MTIGGIILQLINCIEYLRHSLCGFYPETGRYQQLVLYSAAAAVCEARRGTGEEIAALTWRYQGVGR
jgi:hypothetical protein